MLAAEAATYSGMNEPAIAIELLDKAMAKGFRDVDWLTSSDHFTAIRALPAYDDLLNRYGLDGE